jgi:ABC-type antimicrobial peptide transport system permease subunit
MAMAASLLFSFKTVILHSLRLPYLLPSPVILTELIAGAVMFSIITGLLSSLLPAISASRMEPYEAIRKGE